MPRIRNPRLLEYLHLIWRECAICTAIDELHLHHLRYRSQGGDDVEENLIMLCRSCHDEVHAHDRRTLQALRVYLESERPEAVEFLRN